MNHFRDDPTFLQNNSFQKRDPKTHQKLSIQNQHGQLKKTPQKPLTQNNQRLWIKNKQVHGSKHQSEKKKQA